MILARFYCCVAVSQSLVRGTLAIQLDVEHEIGLVWYPRVAVKLHPALIRAITNVLGWNGSNGIALGVGRRQLLVAQTRWNNDASNASWQHGWNVVVPNDCFFNARNRRPISKSPAVRCAFILGGVDLGKSSSCGGHGIIDRRSRAWFDGLSSSNFGVRPLQPRFGGGQCKTTGTRCRSCWGSRGNQSCCSRWGEQERAS